MQTVGFQSVRVLRIENEIHCRISRRSVRCAFEVHRCVASPWLHEVLFDILVEVARTVAKSWLIST
jgi:hypothetical protein